MRNFFLTCSLVVLAAAGTPAQAPSPPAGAVPSPAAPQAPVTTTSQPPTQTTTPPVVTPAPVVPPVPAALPLAGPTAMVYHAIKADRTADFEAVMTRLRDVLGASGNEVRRRQGAGWRVFRQATPLEDGSVLYVSLIDPVVVNAEYDVPRLLAEAAPAEAAQLYEQFRDAHVQPTVQASNVAVVIAPVPASAAPAVPAVRPVVPPTAPAAAPKP